MKPVIPSIKSALIIVFMLCLPGCRIELQHGLSEAQANEILLALVSQGMDAEKTRDSGNSDQWMITVPEEQSSDALSVLVEQALPRERHSGFEELFRKDGFLPSEMQEQARYLAALSGELQQTLESDDSVLTARVHIHIESRNGLLRSSDPPEASASVFMKIVPDADPEETLTDDAVREMISNSVANLLPEHVSVVRSTGRKHRSIPSGQNSLRPPDHRSANKRRATDNDSKLILLIPWVMALAGLIFSGTAGVCILRRRNSMEVIRGRAENTSSMQAR
ncbi:MAG TPA: hypothetical protein PLV45_16065 [bacterium]|nr:hypothetical protein [bacterium]